MPRFPSFLFLAFLIPCAAQTPGAPHYDGLDGVDLYSNGYVIGWDSPKYSQVTVYGPETKPIYAMPVHGEKGLRCSALSLDSDGVAACTHEDLPPWTGSIELLDGAGRLIQTIKTGSYIPEQVVFAPDRSFWTAGFGAPREGVDGDFDVFHHYSRNGKEIGEAAPWSQLPADHNRYTAVQCLLGGTRLYAGDDRLGLVASLKDGQHSWIEISSGGVMLGIYDLGICSDVCYSPAAMTPSGAVYAHVYREGEPDGFAVLNHSDKAWHALKGFPKGRLIGAAADTLVFSKHDESGAHLTLVSASSLTYR